MRIAGICHELERIPMGSFIPADPAMPGRKERPLRRVPSHSVLGHAMPRPRPAWSDCGTRDPTCSGHIRSSTMLRRHQRDRSKQQCGAVGNVGADVVLLRMLSLRRCSGTTRCDWVKSSILRSVGCCSAPASWLGPLECFSSDFGVLMTDDDMYWPLS